MERIVASLAAVLAALALAACGTEEGAEPDAPTDGAPSSRGLELVLDFQPNPVHAGIYAALAEGAFSERGLDLQIREPGSSTDAPKLLEAGRADLAILDIHDLALARERGADLVGIGAIVQRPLAAVIADGERIGSAADLFGATVGVTGLPSDDAVLAAVLASAEGSGPQPRTPTIGFQSVSALANGRVDAATAFWNAEGVALRALGVETRELRVDDFGAPRYPELVVVAPRRALEGDRETYAEALAALRGGYETAATDPDAALQSMVDQLPEADPEAFEAQMRALSEADAFEPALRLDREVLEQWATWDARYGIVEAPPDVDAAFDFSLLEP